MDTGISSDQKPFSVVHHEVRVIFFHFFPRPKFQENKTKTCLTRLHRVLQATLDSLFSSPSPLKARLPDVT